MSKLKVGDKVEVVGNVDTKGLIGTIKNIVTYQDPVFCYEYFTSYLLDNAKETYSRIELKKVEEGKNMSKTFREVIADIKEGEVWEVTHKSFVIEEISMEDNVIVMSLSQPRTDIGDGGEYTLRRNKVTFTEAFKAYEEGKEIESCYTWFKYKKHIVKDFDNGVFVNNEFKLNDGYVFSLSEIRGEWYIND